MIIFRISQTSEKKTEKKYTNMSNDDEKKRFSLLSGCEPLWMCR